VNNCKIVHELPQRLRFKIDLLAQAVDVTYLEIQLTRQVGVQAVRVNPAARTVVVDYDGKNTTKTNLKIWCEQLSTDNCPISTAKKNPAPDIGAVVISGLTMLIIPFLPYSLRAVLTYLTITPTISKAANTLVTRGIKVEVLDGVAVGLAAISGKFFTAATTHSLLELGSYLEAKTQYQSDALLRHLLHPLPSKAWIEVDGVIIEVESSAIKEGDIVVIGVGEMIPVDGKVISGLADVNQASLTGETVPVAKEIGDRVMSGTVLESGRLKIRAMRVGNNTTTARISQFIEDSLGKQSQTQCLAEELADQRVLYTMGLGILVYAFTRSWQRVAAVFLVDYACAIKLGTPVAIKSSIYRGATHGILFRGGQSLENLQQANSLVFDKTGTMTTGVLEMTDVISFDEQNWPEQKLLALAASVEEHATHPVADAVVNSAKVQQLNHIDHEDVDYMVAHGITSKINGENLAIGSLHFMEAHLRVDFTAKKDIIEELESKGKTLLYLALNTMPLGIIALRDYLRPEVPQVLAQLRNLGFKHLILLTGDNKDKAIALSESLGMDEVYYECPPERKAAIVTQLREQGQIVAFVGDGVNDAPALISASVGISMPRGADLARATAAIVLLDDDLHTLVYAKELSNRTMQMLQTHFVVSTAANSVVAAAAAFGFLSPISTALLHNGTTIGVLLNSLSGVSLQQNRLEEWKEKLATLREASKAQA
jgi:manganese/zinc-transporting P-type ATPase C